MLILRGTETQTDSAAAVVSGQNIGYESICIGPLPNPATPCTSPAKKAVSDEIMSFIQYASEKNMHDSRSDYNTIHKKPKAFHFPGYISEQGHYTASFGHLDIPTAVFDDYIFT